MRVLHICQRDDPDIGGSLRVVEALVREQRKAGVDVWLLFLYGEAAGIAEEFMPRVKCLELSCSRQAVSGLRQLAHELKQLKPDIIHSHDGILWPRLVYFSSGIPVVTHGHLPPTKSGGFKKRLGWPVTKNTSDAVIGISQYTMDAWVAAGYPERKIHLVPNGVDFARFPNSFDERKAALRSKLGLPVDKQIILWVGRLHQAMKGTDRVENIAHNLPDGVMLVIVGNGPEHEGMEQRLNKPVREKRVVLAGSIPEPEAYYQAADAYLFTSYFEPFGLVILEAVASALPILAFPVLRGGGAIELLQEFNAEEVKDDSSPEEICKAIERTLKKENALQLREVAMEQYSWETASRKMVEIYEQMLGIKTVAVHGEDHV